MMRLDLLHGILTGVLYWYMYVYMYCWEKQPRCVTLWLSVFGDKWLCHDTLIFYSFVSASIWKWKFVFMYFIYVIEEIDVNQENLSCIIWYICKEKQLCWEKYFYYMFISVRGMIISLSVLITICYRTFIRTYKSLATFQYVLIFNRFITLVSVTAITWVC